MKRLLFKVILGGVALALLPFFAFSFAPISSVSCGAGRAPTKPMPIVSFPFGSNYNSYCIPCILGLRTFARNEVIDTVASSYRWLLKTGPDTHFVYAELGFPWGGWFHPHRTHRQGLSVDFHVPIKNGKTITTNIFNRYGYDAEFDENGIGEDGAIDFEAIREHLKMLQSEATRRGGRVARVFFAPDLQDNLFPNAGVGHKFEGMTFNKKPSWVRHDDHYHVDFAFPCPNA